MSEKHLEDRGGGQDDLIERIITQGLAQIKAPLSETEPSGPGPEDGGETVSPADRKNGSPAVCFCLTILFGAAFLMTLLACFVQRRSSEDTISDLRNSMTLSRQELLDEIRELEEQNAALQEDLDTYKEGYSYWMERYGETQKEANDLWDQNDTAQEELYAWMSFWKLEQYYQAGDYESCAAVLLLQEQGQYPYRAPDAARQAEIVQAVIEAGILDERYYTHPGDYNDLLGAYYSNVLLFGWTERLG